MRARKDSGSVRLESATLATSRMCIEQETPRPLFSLARITGAAALLLAATVSVGSLAGEVSDPPSAVQKGSSAAGAWLSLDEEPLEANPLPQSGSPPQIGSSPKAGAPPRVGVPLESGGSLRSATLQKRTRPLASTTKRGSLSAASDQAKVARSGADSPETTNRLNGAMQVSPLFFTPVPGLQRARLPPHQWQPIEPAPSPRTASPLQMGAPPRIGSAPKLAHPPGIVSESKAEQRD